MACSTASSVPIRERWTAWTAVTMPMVRPRDPREVGDLPADVHPHLEDRDLVLGREAQDGQRQPDLVVLVPDAPRGPKGATEHGRHRFLRRGLRDAAGDADDEEVEPRPPRGRDRAERGDPIADANDRHVTERCGIDRRPGHDQRGRPGRDRVDQVGVAIDPFAGQGDEDLSGLDLAGVDGSPADGSVRPLEEPSAGHPGELLRREGVGHGARRRIRHGHRTAVCGGVMGRSNRRSGVLMALLAMRWNNWNDITGISSWPMPRMVGVPSSMRMAMTRSGTPFSRAM